jgi:prepilin-type N-terminal cleavage/methylation domain-containing protein
MKPQSIQSRTRRFGFTLIELLVVIAIIGMLAAMLLPVLAKAKIKAKGVQAIGNFRNITHGWHMYSDENDDLILPGRFGK